MATRELLTPLLLGALVAGGLWFWAPSEVELPTPRPATESVETPYILMPHAIDDPNTTLLWFGEGARHPLGGPLDVHAGSVQGGAFSWSGLDWACLRQPAPCQPTGNASSRAPIPVSTTPEGNGTVAANSVVEVTFLMFTTDGRLLASNAGRSLWDNLTLSGDFTPVSTKRWYLGEGDAPAGSVQVPELRRETRDILVGTPVGGVRTSVLETHRYDDLVGELWITARVEAVA